LNRLCFQQCQQTPRTAIPTTRAHRAPALTTTRSYSPHVRRLRRIRRWMSSRDKKTRTQENRAPRARSSSRTRHLLHDLDRSRHSTASSVGNTLQMRVQPSGCTPPLNETTRTASGKGYETNSDEESGFSRPPHDVRGQFLDSGNPQSLAAMHQSGQRVDSARANSNRPPHGVTGQFLDPGNPESLAAVHQSGQRVDAVSATDGHNDYNVPMTARQSKGGRIFVNVTRRRCSSDAEGYSAHGAAGQQLAHGGNIGASPPGKGPGRRTPQGYEGLHPQRYP
jgi:hypothetical protein